MVRQLKQLRGNDIIAPGTTTVLAVFTSGPVRSLMGSPCRGFGRWAAKQAAVAAEQLNDCLKRAAARNQALPFSIAAAVVGDAGAASGATAATTSASPAAAATAAGFPPSRPIWHLHSDPLALPRQPLVQQMSLPQPQQQGLQSLQPRGVQRQHRHQQPALEQHQPSEGQQQPQTRSQVLPPRSLHLLASVALATVAQQQSPQLQPLPLQLQRPQSTLQMAADAAQPPAAARVGTASAEILGSRPRAHGGFALLVFHVAQDSRLFGFPLVAVMARVP